MTGCLGQEIDQKTTSPNPPTRVQATLPDIDAQSIGVS